jgi:hypothetical protein
MLNIKEKLKPIDAPPLILNGAIVAAPIYVVIAIS